MWEQVLTLKQKPGCMLLLKARQKGLESDTASYFTDNHTSKIQVFTKNLESLLSQTAIVDQINLYIPREYRRFNYDPRDIPKLPKGVNLHICKKTMVQPQKYYRAANNSRARMSSSCLVMMTEFTTRTGPNGLLLLQNIGPAM